MYKQNSCIVCGKNLCIIGRERKNSKVNENYNDWSSRKTHKKCYSQYLLMIKYKKIDEENLKIFKKV